jgi:ABC-2 type transport system ATP-binding protein
LIEIRNLHKRFGEKHAVRGLTLAIPAGELFVLLGPNGAGKTTTIRILSGLLHPTGGSAGIGGHDVVTDGVAARGLLAYIPDQPYLYEKLTAREFLRFVGELYSIPRPEIDTGIERLAERFGFTGYIDDLCAGYSHGMRQRVVIAAALLHKPRALVIDEPMVGLDPRSARVVKDVLRELVADGVAVLMSTHTLPVAEELAHRIGIIRQGCLAALGTLQEIREQVGADDQLEGLFLRLTEEQSAAFPNTEPS